MVHLFETRVWEESSMLGLTFSEIEKFCGVRVLNYGLPENPLSIAEIEARDKQMRVARGMTLQVEGDTRGIERYVKALNGTVSIGDTPGFSSRIFPGSPLVGMTLAEIQAKYFVQLREFDFPNPANHVAMTPVTPKDLALTAVPYFLLSGRTSSAFYENFMNAFLPVEE
ncbi:hypothetical protein KA107_02905 [Candidatus Pacearchaeota archaeon]|nr:hypothetical protein [Candidatus Pacearchaeota archaeon]